jgi:hypothetical protein
VHHYHNVAKSFKVDGHDPSKTPPGVVIWNRDPARLARVVEYNNKMRASTSSMPTFDATKAHKSSLAGTHYTLALNMYDQKMSSLITGLKHTLPGAESVDHDLSLQQQVEKGHVYWVLSDTITEEEAHVVSDWRNSDQDRNLAFGPTELQRRILTVMQKSTPSTSTIPNEQQGPSVGNKGKMSINRIVAEVTTNSVTQIPPDIVNQYAKWVGGLGAGSLVEEYLEWISTQINSGELQVSPNFLEVVIDNIKEQFPIIRMIVGMIQHDPDEVSKKIRPNADIGKLIANSEVIAIGKQTDLLERLETFIRECRMKLMAALTGNGTPLRLQRSQILNLFRPLELSLVRLTFSKVSKEQWMGITGVVNDMPMENEYNQKLQT